MRIAIIGYGGMGGWHVDKIATIEGLELAGVYDICSFWKLSYFPASIQAFGPHHCDC